MFYLVSPKRGHKHSSIGGFDNIVLSLLSSYNAGKVLPKIVFYQSTC